MITIAHMVCVKRKGIAVDVSDIKKVWFNSVLLLGFSLVWSCAQVYTLFVDVKRSTEFLQAYQNEFVFSELAADEDEDDEM